MTRITGEIVIDAPADVVFDSAAGQRNEPAYNSHMVGPAKVTPGPAGRGTGMSTTQPRTPATGWLLPGPLAVGVGYLSPGMSGVAWPMIQWPQAYGHCRETDIGRCPWLPVSSGPRGWTPSMRRGFTWTARRT